MTATDGMTERLRVTTDPEYFEEHAETSGACKS